MKNSYMGLTEIMAVLLNLDYADTSRIKQLFDSVETGDFYTKYSSVTEMTQNDQLKKLAANLFTYYTAKKGKVEEEFYKNMKTLIGSLYNNNKEDVKELLLYALSVSDEKKRYDLLKQLLVLLKDENVKNKIYSSIVWYSCATLKDYNSYLNRLAYGGCVSLKYEQISKLFSNWMVKIKQFVFEQDHDPEYFDSVFQEINGILIKFASFYPDIVKNIRYVCQIQPSVAYKQEYFKNVYSGADVITSNTMKDFLMMREQIEQLNKQIILLKDQNNQQDIGEEIRTLRAGNYNLRKKYDPLREENQNLKTENQKLREENQNLKTENQKLKTENHTLKLDLDSTNVLLERFKRLVR